MKTKANNILNDLIVEWWRWSKGWTGVAGYNTCAMFHDVKSSRQWDSETDVLDGSLHNSQMKAVDFHIGELDATHRTAIQIQARNLATGASVWRSPRLPTDPNELAKVITEAKLALLKRLDVAGVV